jgi:hypothetical protein
VPENEEKLFSEVVRNDLVELLYKCHSLETVSAHDDNVYFPKRTFGSPKYHQKLNYDKLKAKYKDLFAENAPAKQN